MQPQLFRKMRADLASMWSSSNRAGYPRRTSNKSGSLSLDEKILISDSEDSVAFSEDTSTMKVLSSTPSAPINILTNKQMEG